MQNLLIEEGSLLSITNVSLPKATYVKLQPQHVDFLEISNPRAVLEHALRNFSCVTKGDVIQLPFCNKNYHFELKEVKPQDAACIIETDCNVDFDAPVGYKEPETNSSRNSSFTGGNGGSGNDNVANNDSLGATLANIPKQSAFANKNNSGRSSPALSSISGTSTSANNQKMNNEQDPSSSSSSIRIVNGKVIRPDNYNHNNDIQCDNNNTTITNQPYIPEQSISSIIANQTGSTGVQRNSAIAISAPQVDYWAVNAGDGARLDGKKSVLKDKDGNEVDVRKLRAEAAAKRLESLNGGSSNGIMPSAGQMVNGTVVVDESSNDDVNNNSASSAATGTSAAATKRKSRIGSKYSKLKQSGAMAFQGSSNTFNK